MDSPFACIAPDELRAWRKMNDRLGVSIRAGSLCDDCTVEYKREMTRRGTCARSLGLDVREEATLAGAERVHAPAARARREHIRRAKEMARA